MHLLLIDILIDILIVFFQKKRVSLEMFCLQKADLMYSNLYSVQRVFFMFIFRRYIDSPWFSFNDTNKYFTIKKNPAQLAGAVEYTDCISAKRQDSLNKCPGYNIKQSDSEAQLLELWVM